MCTMHSLLSPCLTLLYLVGSVRPVKTIDLEEGAPKGPRDLLSVNDAGNSNVRTVREPVAILQHGVGVG